MLKKKDAAQLASECPFNLNWHEALYVLYALSHYEAILEYRKGGHLNANIFYNELFSVLSGLRNHASRKTILSLLQNPTCFAFNEETETLCGKPVKLEGARLDHVIPASKGGPDNLENTLPLCRSHNSSKGGKDLIEWWLVKEWPPRMLGRRQLAIYARLMWQHLDKLFEDPYDLPDFIRQFITDYTEVFLPTEDHKLTLYGSTYAAMGFLNWERMYESNIDELAGIR